MEIHEDSPFTINQANPDAPVYVVIRRWSPEIIPVIEAGNVTRILIESDFEGDARQLSALERVASQIEWLELPSKPKLDLQFLSRLTGLRELHVHQLDDSADFAALERLEKVTLYKGARLGKLADAPNLSSLQLFGTRLDHVASLSRFSRLRDLTLRGVSGLKSLDGIQSVPVTSLELVSVRGLTSVAAVRDLRALEVFLLSGGSGISDMDAVGGLTSLRVIAISSGPPLPGFDFVADSLRLTSFAVQSTNMATQACSIGPFTRMAELKSFGLRAGPSKGFRCIRDLERLGEIRSLEYLMVDRGPDVETIGFLGNLERLRTLRWTRTTIADGDLSPILGLHDLEKLQLFPEQKHYSHSVSSLLAAWNAAHEPLGAKALEII